MLRVVPQHGMFVLITVSALALAFGTGTVHASPLYGVISDGDVVSGNGPSAFPTQTWNYSQGGNPQQVTSYTSPVLSGAGSFTFGASTVLASAMAWGSVNFGVLHGYATATSSGTCQTCAVPTETGGLFDVNWYDTIFVTGLPAGTPVDLQLTVALNSSETTGGTVTSFSEIGSQQVSVNNTNGVANGLITKSEIIQTVSGAMLQFTSSLQGSASVSDLLPFESATADASDTANSYIAVLTQGASYTAASGANYVAPSSVPEPKSIWLIVPALGVLWFSICRRSSKSGISPNVSSAKRSARLAIWC